VRKSLDGTAWLADHPEVEVVLRDRGGYGQRVARAATDVVQVWSATRQGSGRRRHSSAPTPLVPEEIIAIFVRRWLTSPHLL
jgi:hypothetical protein